MARSIKLIGSPVLRKKARPVAKSQFGSEELLSAVREMSEILRNTDEGIGLAAPQVGLPLRIYIASEEALAIDAGTEVNGAGKDGKKNKKLWRHYVFINPEIIKRSAKKQTAVEGCLSIPKKYGLVERAEKVRVRAYDEYGNVFERGASKLFARLMQHEIDHLSGVLYVDKARDIADVDDK